MRAASRRSCVVPGLTVRPLQAHEVRCQFGEAHPCTLQRAASGTLHMILDLLSSIQYSPGESTRLAHWTTSVPGRRRRIFASLLLLPNTVWAVLSYGRGDAVTAWRMLHGSHASSACGQFFRTPLFRSQGIDNPENSGYSGNGSDDRCSNAEPSHCMRAAFATLSSAIRRWYDSIADAACFHAPDCRVSI